MNTPSPIPTHTPISFLELSSAFTQKVMSVDSKLEEAVLLKSVELPKDTPVVKGYDFNNGVDYDALFKSYLTTGFQATNFALAIDQVNQMVRDFSRNILSILLTLLV
jgi:hypothetical protein